MIKKVTGDNPVEGKFDRTLAERAGSTPIEQGQLKLFMKRLSLAADDNAVINVKFVPRLAQPPQQRTYRDAPTTGSSDRCDVRI